MEENTQLNESGLQADTFWLRECRVKSSMTGTQMCSKKAPTTASWSNGPCNGPTALFKTMWTRYGFFGKMEVSEDL